MTIHKAAYYVSICYPASGKAYGAASYQNVDGVFETIGKLWLPENHGDEFKVRLWEICVAHRTGKPADPDLAARIQNEPFGRRVEVQDLDRVIADGVQPTMF